MEVFKAPDTLVHPVNSTSLKVFTTPDGLALLPPVPVTNTNLKVFKATQQLGSL